MVTNDLWIRYKAIQCRMIEPFVDYDQEDQTGKISYGLSSYGYDARLANEFKVFNNTHFAAHIDPKALDVQSFVEKEGDSCIIPPNGYVLARTVETFRIPRHILAICLGKSTYARSGILVNTTPLEPSWEGTITLEIGNCTPLPAKIYANEGICQIIFLLAGDFCERSYADKQGKYMDQTGVTLPKVL